MIKVERVRKYKGKETLEQCKRIDFSIILLLLLQCSMDLIITEGLTINTLVKAAYEVALSLLHKL